MYPRKGWRNKQPLCGMDVIIIECTGKYFLYCLCYSQEPIMKSDDSDVQTVSVVNSNRLFSRSDTISILMRNKSAFLIRAF